MSGYLSETSVETEKGTLFTGLDLNNLISHPYENSNYYL